MQLLVCYAFIIVLSTWNLKLLFFLWLHQPPADMELTYACLGMSSNTTTAPVPPSVPCDTRRRGWFSVSCKDHADNRERSQAITWRPAAHVVKHECLQGRVCEWVCVWWCLRMTTPIACRDTWMNESKGLAWLNAASHFQTIEELRYSQAAAAHAFILIFPRTKWAPDFSMVP